MSWWPEEAGSTHGGAFAQAEGGGRASPGTGNAGHGLMYQELGGSVSPVRRDLFDKP